ncbi:helix-turn-helix domain-containing protein [Undibacterium sp. LX40W]|uniref:Helix-turn-helix domain-containing protein n=1 Tax=Undibacterium nitidum TaxID=2762298 RepID=A0A923KLI2_9BURK|nr:MULTISPECIES: helix-turn-helix domain-containing protein [Undibacterium]MBC3881880.1 helix-turn-helix domain-containing protein [Undibacterium nitidum]MBC3892123.1 helix-turn-helix domain-containing protein [Undibacterium sp. LX40W]
MRIYILALDGVFDIGLSSLIDVISTANELGSQFESSEGAGPQLDMRLVSVRKKVCTSQGLTVPSVLATDLPTPDVVLIPALGAKMPVSLAAALEAKEVKDAGIVLKKWAAAGAMIGAACTGTFVLAETGLLDGQQATTSWWLSALFRQRYPAVELDESRMLVNSSCFTTAGAALAHLDLALGVVRSTSPSLAALCARYLLIEPRSSQAVFVIPDHVAHNDAVVERFERWARGHLAEGFSMTDATKAIGASERTLGRRIQAVLGKSALEYFQDLRVERAVHLLQTSTESVDQIAALVGYSDGTTLRSLLRRKLGKGVRELREKP